MIVCNWFRHYFTSIVHYYGIIYVKITQTLKLRLQSGEGTKSFCLKSWEDPSQEPYIKKNYMLFGLYGILAGTTKMKLKFGKHLKSRNWNWISAAFAQHGIWYCLLEQKFHCEIWGSDGVVEDSGLLGQWLFSYSNPSTDQLPLVSHAYDFRSCLEIWEPQPPGTLRACSGL